MGGWQGPAMWGLVGSGLGPWGRREESRVHLMGLRSGAATLLPNLWSNASFAVAKASVGRRFRLAVVLFPCRCRFSLRSPRTMGGHRMSDAGSTGGALRAQL